MYWYFIIICVYFLVDSIDTSQTYVVANKEAARLISFIYVFSSLHYDIKSIR